MASAKVRLYGDTQGKSTGSCDYLEVVAIMLAPLPSSTFQDCMCIYLSSTDRESHIQRQKLSETGVPKLPWRLPAKSRLSFHIRSDDT